MAKSIAHCPSEAESFGEIDQIGKAQAHPPSPKRSFLEHLAKHDREKGVESYLTATFANQDDEKQYGTYLTEVESGKYPPDTTYPGWLDEPATDDHLVE